METLTEGFSFDESTHTYSLLGKAIPSATQVISAFNRSYDNVPEFVLKRKAQIGTDVHDASCLIELGIQPEETDQTGPYLDGYRQFIDKYKPNAILMEQRYVGFLDDIAYGMTVDRVSVIDNRVWLIDLKTSAKPHKKAWGLQLAAYANGLMGIGYGDVLVNSAVVHLKKDGSFSFIEIDHNEYISKFKAALITYDFFGLGNAKKG